MAAAHGGQVLVSSTSAGLVQGELPPDVALRDMGAHRLKGLASVEHLWQVVAPDLPSEFPHLQSLDARPNNLPIPLTPFIGRQAALAEALKLLGHTRLITLAGPGGTGKTRLAIQTATEALAGPDFPDGAWLVELAPLSNPELVLPTAASVLNVRAQPGRAPHSALADFLRSKRLLIILDNCEHLIEHCTRAAEALLQAGAGIKVLATSREPLGIAGETVVRVASLAVPPAAATVAELLANEAVQLFVQRARAVKPGFELTSQNAEAVGQICRRLDGIPLALELAAARVALFTPARIADRLDDRFRLLTGSQRSAMPRQQTLEALIDWSYDLLAPEEKELFRALSVFTGGFSYEAAEAVGGGDILETLAQLVNKSLVLVEEDPGEGDGQLDEIRYRLPETVRQYAVSKLMAAGEAEATRDRHLAYFVQFSIEAEAQLGAGNQRRWARLAEADRDNLGTAIEWALQRQPVTAIEMIARQGYFWGQRGHTSEALRWLDRAMAELAAPGAAEAATPTERALVMAQAYGAKAVLIEVLGDEMGAFAALEASVKLWREADEPRGLAEALALLGSWGVFFGVPNPYRAAAEEALAIGRQGGYDTAAGTALAGLGIEKMLLGEYAAAEALIEESVAVLRQGGDARFANMGLTTLGSIAHLQGDHRLARTRYAESMAIFEDYKLFYYANIARSGLADALRAEKDYARAVPLLLETLNEWRAMGNHGAVARSLECLAFIGADRALAAPPEAQPALLARTATLLGTAEALREAKGAPMPPTERAEYDEQVGRLQAAAAPEALAAARQQGRGLSVDEALAVAEGLRALSAYTPFENASASGGP
jgi:predicted ATPase